MIPLATLERTANELMAKAAIEIPEDYLAGLRACADTEKGDLSAFVIQAMLENYEAAKEDRRAMCGDTGVPRWYVKYGNGARVEGGPMAGLLGAIYDYKLEQSGMVIKFPVERLYHVDGTPREAFVPRR